MDDLAQVFLLTVVAWYGVPERLISNCDPCFVFAFQKELMSAFGAYVALSIVYHSQRYGQSELQHRSLYQIHRCFVSPIQHDGDVLLP